MARIPMIARYLLGGTFLLFGLNGFLHFIPQPPPPEAAGAFLGGLAGAGYFFPLLKLTEIAAGVALLANRLVPLALTVLASIVVNIVAFHAFLAPAGLGIALAVLVLEAYVAWTHRDAFRSVVAWTPSPRVDATPSLESALADPAE